MATIKKAQAGAKVSSETMALRKKYAAEAQQQRNNNAANAKNEIKQNAAKADSLRKVYAKKPMKKAQDGTKVDKTSTGAKRNIAKDIKSERVTIAKKNKSVTNSYKKESTDYRKQASTTRRASINMNSEHDYNEPTMGRSRERSKSVSRFGMKEADRLDSLSSSSAKKAKMSVKSPKYKPALKKGGVVKKKK